MKKEEVPDLTKPLSRFNAPAWAMRYGIAAALKGDSRWAVWCALADHLPNVKPGMGKIAKLAGVSLATVKRTRKSLRDVGLIAYEESAGGSDEDTCEYKIADIRHKEIAAEIVKKLTGLMVNPAHSEPPTGLITDLNQAHGEPQSTQSLSTQEKPLPAAPQGGSISASPREGSEAMRHAPSDAELVRWGISSADAMEAYFRFGPEGYGKTVAECEAARLPSAARDYLQHSTKDQPFHSEWTTQHFAAWFWVEVSKWRESKGVSITAPKFGRLCKHVQQIGETRGDAYNVYCHLWVIIRHFDLIKFRLGNMAIGWVLDESALSNPYVSREVLSLFALGDQGINDEYGRMEKFAVA